MATMTEWNNDYRISHSKYTNNRKQEKFLGQKAFLWTNDFRYNVASK